MERGAIARCLDRNDVLFEIDGGPELAMVHLTYQKPADPNFPNTLFFDSLEDFVSDDEFDDDDTRGLLSGGSDLESLSRGD